MAGQHATIAKRVKFLVFGHQRMPFFIEQSGIMLVICIGFNEWFDVEMMG